MSDFDDIDLAVLPDEDLIKQMHDDLYDGLGEEIVEEEETEVESTFSDEEIQSDEDGQITLF